MVGEARVSGGSVAAKALNRSEHSEFHLETTGDTGLAAAEGPGSLCGVGKK